MPRRSFSTSVTGAGCLAKETPAKKAATKAAPKKAAVKKIYDYTGLEKGMKVQAEADGTYYAAEVVQVSTAKNRTKAPVKISYKGYEGYDEWVGGDRLRSKALKVSEPPKKEEKKKEKKERPPEKLKDGEEIPIKRVSRIYTFKVADEAAAIKVDAIINEVHALLAANRKEKAKGFIKSQRTVCKSEWAFEFAFVFNNFENFKAYDDSDWRKETLVGPYVPKLKELAKGGEFSTGVRVYDELR